MKKSNNKYHNNSNNNNNYNPIYSLNYKFDSISPAGKYCGTALDLIRKYNDLAKEALGNGNYVEAEVFRQYAEHYRKIVTDINERKNQRAASFQNNNDTLNSSDIPTAENAPAPLVAADRAEAQIAPVSPTAPQEPAANPRPRRTYQPRRPQNQPETESSRAAAAPAPSAPVEASGQPAKREFKVIEISHAESKAELINDNKTAKTVKPTRRKSLTAAML